MPNKNKFQGVGGSGRGNLSRVGFSGCLPYQCRHMGCIGDECDDEVACPSVRCSPISARPGRGRQRHLMLRLKWFSWICLIIMSSCVVQVCWFRVCVCDAEKTTTDRPAECELRVVVDIFKTEIGEQFLHTRGSQPYGHLLQQNHHHILDFIFISGICAP